jgi:hypothetical protein
MSEPVKQEVNGTVILPHLVFPGKKFYSIELKKKVARSRGDRKIVSPQKN